MSEKLRELVAELDRLADYAHHIDGGDGEVGLDAATVKSYTKRLLAALAEKPAERPRDKMECWMAARDWCSHWTVSMAAVDSLAELLMEFQRAERPQLGH